VKKGSRYVVSRRGTINLVSSSPIVSEDDKTVIVGVPPDLQHLTPSELMLDYRIQGGKLRPRARSRRGPAKGLKVAFVGNWKMQCGIATYSENLWPEIAKHVGDFKLFIEKNDVPTGPTNVIGDVAIPPDRVIACWKRGEKLTELARAIREYDPDIVAIQHEFGIWPNASYWLALMSQLSHYRVIVTMHSVFHHKDKTIVEAAMPEIVVHLEGARRVLQDEKGLTQPIHVIPHGCTPVTNIERLWNFYKSEHTFMQFGFGFRYKGWELSIRAADVLRCKYPDVFFTGLFSESPYNRVDHQVYYDELCQLIDDLDLHANVGLIKGYQSDVALDSYMRTNQVIVFPYVSHPQHEVFGVSGAARLAMSKMAPVITTSVNHFSDVPTLKADTPEEIAAALDVMFSNPVARKAQVDAQLAYLNETTWAKVALRYIRLFEEGATE
jgi:glycosyltransferase involved in cell wall biosynthesis